MIYKPRTERVFHRFVCRIDTQFAEDVLAVGGDGMDTGEALGSNLLGGLTQSNGLDDFRLRLRQDAGCLVLLLLLGDDGLKGTLTEVSRMATDSIQGFLDFTQGTILEHYAELMGGINHATDELRCEIVADEYPVGEAEAFGNNKQLFFVGKVEQRVIEQHHGTLVLLEQFYEASLIEGTIYGILLVFLKEAL